MAVILGARREAETFGRLGVAFQLTNFVRDVRVDYQLGRIYLPRRSWSGSAWIRPRSAWCRRRLNPGALISDEVGRARALFGETAAAVGAALPGAAARYALRPCRLPLVLDRVEAVDYDVLAASITREPGASRGPSLHDHGRSRDPELTRPRLRCINLPRDAVTVRASSTWAESVVVEWHQHRSSVHSWPNSASTSSAVSHVTKIDIDGVKPNSWATGLLKATNGRFASVNLIV